MSLKVLTFNIRYGEADDGPNSWQFRRELAIETVRDRNPDLLGLQEPTGKQWDDLTRGLPGMTGVFADAQDKGPFPHGVAAMFRADRFELASQRIFWQSGTPDIPGSVTFPNHWGPRPTLALRLKDRRDGFEFVFSCTHFDTHGDCWLPSAKVNAIELGKFAGKLPLILVGDYNCSAGSEAWRYLTGTAGFRDAWTEAGLPDEMVTTFHGFKGFEKLPPEGSAELEELINESNSIPEFAHYPAHIRKYRNERIDWILFRGPWKASCAGLDIRKKSDGLCASDHWAVEAVLDRA